MMPPSPSRTPPRRVAALAGLAVLLLIWTVVLLRSSPAPPPAQGSGAPAADHRAGRVQPPSQAAQRLQPATADPGNTSSLAAPEADELRPLVLYAYADSEAARANLRFFLAQGLHAAADFVFIASGPGLNASSLGIPLLANVRVVSRPRADCYDLGAHSEVLRRGDLWRRYRRFVLLNSSVRGPFLPYWSRACWSDLFLRRVTGKVKLVGMTSNCWPQFHVQSHVWATDAVGIDLLLHPRPGALARDGFGDEGDAVGLAGCYVDWRRAVHAEVGATRAVRSQGYDVDVLMRAFHRPGGGFIEACDASRDGDVLRPGGYFGTNVHPYETVFAKTDRDLDPALLGALTEWHQGAAAGSWAACGTEAAW